MAGTIENATVAASKADYSYLDAIHEQMKASLRKGGTAVTTDFSSLMHALMVYPHTIDKCPEKAIRLILQLAHVEYVKLLIELNQEQISKN